MSFWTNINPGGAISEFIFVFRHAGRNRWWIALLSAAITVGMIAVLTMESWKMPRKLPEVTYITTFPEDWSEAESKAFRAENQRRKEQRQAEQAAYEAEGRKLWEDLGRASGMDVEAIKKKAEAERAAEAAKSEAAPAPVPQQAERAPVDQ